MYPGGFYSQMTLREAQLILGVIDKTDHAGIKAKHRQIMMNNHPDNNGSTYLATKINEAKDMLLNGWSSTLSIPLQPSKSSSNVSITIDVLSETQLQLYFMYFLAVACNFQ